MLTSVQNLRQPLAACQVDGLLQLPTVIAFTGLSRSKIYALAAEGKFPAAVRLSTKCSRWSSAAVRAWVNSKVEL